MNYPINKIPVAVLGATGAVGQRFVRLLANHPWFYLSTLAASDRSAGKRYSEACRWILPDEMPIEAAELTVQPAEPGFEARIVFSALPADAARDIEPAFARVGYTVCSNSSAYRLDPLVPLLIPEMNADHVSLIERQKQEKGWKGLLVTSPNCTTTGAALPLKPIYETYGIKKVFAVSMQAVSGAGYPGIPFLDIHDNVVPFIKGEEEKLQRETLALLGKMVDGKREDAEIIISAQCNRVPVFDGHTVCLSLKLDKKADIPDIIRVLREFKAESIGKNLPSAPPFPLHITEEPDRPQPRRDRERGRGMVVTVGRVRPCPILDVRMVSMVHNTLRGAASGAILNAELLTAKGYIV